MNDNKVTFYGNRGSPPICRLLSVSTTYLECQLLSTQISTHHSKILIQQAASGTIWNVKVNTRGALTYSPAILQIAPRISTISVTTRCSSRYDPPICRQGGVLYVYGEGFPANNNDVVQVYFLGSSSPSPQCYTESVATDVIRCRVQYSYRVKPGMVWNILVNVNGTNSTGFAQIRIADTPTPIPTMTPTPTKVPTPIPKPVQPPPDDSINSKLVIVLSVLIALFVIVSIGLCCLMCYWKRKKKMEAKKKEELEKQRAIDEAAKELEQDPRLKDLENQLEMYETNLKEKEAVVGDKVGHLESQMEELLRKQEQERKAKEDRDNAEKRLKEEREAMENRLKQEREATELRLKEERDATENRLRAERELLHRQAQEQHEQHMREAIAIREAALAAVEAAKRSPGRNNSVIGSPDDLRRQSSTRMRQNSEFGRQDSQYDGIKKRSSSHVGDLGRQHSQEGAHASKRSNSHIPSSRRSNSETPRAGGGTGSRNNTSDANAFNTNRAGAYLYNSGENNAVSPYGPYIGPDGQPYPPGVFPPGHPYYNLSPGGGQYPYGTLSPNSHGAHSPNQYPPGHPLNQKGHKGIIANPNHPSPGPSLVSMDPNTLAARKKRWPTLQDSVDHYNAIDEQVDGIVRAQVNRIANENSSSATIDVAPAPLAKPTEHRSRRRGKQ
eukprot:NODE_981_length_2205_cov_68.685399_g837_i0.p1 GENE.NODE_981_length_2205_cov_68.685399_g837_i0~~NODE_981_length_2205_cov_68.685399_g837_i0.p1  ORF type:complete len:684 (+),score=205.57 NODE_981_length_2205_cov_68.685399_g837_i0:46-2052(+)